MREIREILEEAKFHHELGDFDEAEKIYDKLLAYHDQLDPNLSTLYGCLLSARGYQGLAIHLLRQVVAHYPDFGGAWSNLGCALMLCGRDEAAEFAFTKAVELLPDDPTTLASMSGYWINRGQPEKILEYGLRALKVDPHNAQAHKHYSFGLLETGKIKEAGEHYEYRWLMPEERKNVRPYKAPKWEGYPVKTLAIHGEQGLGDEVFFMAHLRDAQARAGRVVLECAKRLVPVFQECFGIPCYSSHDDLIAAEGEPDAYIPMGSLFGLFGIPDGKPYMHVDVERIPKRVGIAWRGGGERTNKRERTTGLDPWKPILSVPGVEFVSVQYGEEKIQQEAEAHGVKQALIGRSMVDTFDEIAKCDLVITVCQTAVHVAGALGIPCWVLTPKRCAWRYCGRDERMLWYNSVRLFRQDDTETWGPVIERVANELRAKFA